MLERRKFAIERLETSTVVAIGVAVMLIVWLGSNYLAWLMLLPFLR